MPSPHTRSAANAAAAEVAELSLSEMVARASASAVAGGGGAGGGGGGAAGNAEENAEKCNRRETLNEGSKPHLFRDATRARVR